jgi:hypothetical protein
MENTNQVTDEELLVIAKQALEKHFAADDLAGTMLKLEKHGQTVAEDEDGEPPVISVWVMHLNRTFLPNPELTVAANLEMWNQLRKQHDNRTFLLYHGFPSDPARPKKAA